MTTALLLGAAVWQNGPSPALTRRTCHAAALFRTGAVTRIIACGGEGDFPPSEAQVMRDVLVGQGVPPEAILLEDTSTNTVENIANAVTLLDGQTRGIVIVSDAYHLPRALLIARRLGLTATGSASELPNASLRTFRRKLREGAGMIWYGATFWPRR